MKLAKISYLTAVFLAVSIKKATVQRTPLPRVTSEELSADFHDNEGLDRSSRILNQEHVISDVDPEARLRKTIVSGRKFRTNDDRHAQDSRIDKGHNKSRQKSGFYNSYRRDESGTNSSFYEDAVDDGAEKLHHNGVTHFGESANNEFRDGNLNPGYNRRRFPDRDRADFYNQRMFNGRPSHGNLYDQEEAFAEPTPPPFREHRFNNDPGFRAGYNHGPQPYNNERGFESFQRGDHVPYNRIPGRYRQRFPVPQITVFDDPRPARFEHSRDSGYYDGPVPNGPNSGHDDYEQKPQLHILNPSKRYDDYGGDYPHHLESEPGRYRY